MDLTPFVLLLHKCKGQQPVEFKVIPCSVEIKPRLKYPILVIRKRG